MTAETKLPSRIKAMNKVVKLKWLGGYRLHATFSDGATGERDFSAMVAEAGPMAQPLRDAAYFARVFLEDVPPPGLTASICAPIGCAAKSRRPGRWRATPRPDGSVTRTVTQLKV
jgi:Protein of unknown function (DUF2442)